MGVVYSTSIGNPWHGQKPDARRKLDTKNKAKKGKK